MVIGSFRPAKFKTRLLLVVFGTTGLRVQTIFYRIKLTPISSKLAFDALSGAKFTETSDGACDCRPKPKLRCLTNFLLFLESWLAADEAIESFEDFRSTSAFCKQNEYRTISGNSFNQPFWVFIPERAFAQSAWIYLLVTELEGATVSYRPRFFHFNLWPSCVALGSWIEVEKTTHQGDKTFSRDLEN